MDHFYTRRYIIIGLVLCFFVVAFFAWYTYRDLRKTEQKSRSTDNALQSLNALDIILGDMQDLENGQRGYIISGKGKFLEHYTKALLRLEKDTVLLTESLALNLPGDTSLSNFLDMVRQKVQFVTNSVRVRKELGQDSALHLVQSEEGYHLMERIRTYVFGKENELKLFLSRFNAESKSSSLQMARLFGALALFFFLILSILFFQMIRDWKRRDRHEKQLAYLAGLAEQTSDAVLSTDTSFVIRTWNNAAEKIYGYTKEEVIGQPVMTILKLNLENDAYENSLQELLRVGYFKGEYQAEKKNGERLIVLASVTALRDKKNVTTGYVAVHNDITQRTELEKQLRKFNKELELQVNEKTQRYRALIEQASDFIMITDENGNFLDANGNFLKTFGYTKEELTQLNIADLIDPEQLQTEPVRFDLLKKGETVLRERKMMHKDGTLIEVEANMKMLPDGRMLAIARDMRERRKAEQEIRQTNARFEIVSKATTDIVWDWDMINDTLWWNENYFTTTGIGKEKKPRNRQEWFQRIHPEDIGRIRQKIDALIRGDGAYWSEEYRFAKNDGGYLHILDRGHIIRNPDGNPSRMIGSMVDMTPILEAQKIVAESENRLRTIFNSEPQCIKLLDKQSRLLDMNPAGLAILQADSLEQVKGKNVLAVIDDPYKEEFNQLIQDVFQGKSGNLEFTMTGFKGHQRFLETHAVPMRDADGTITALLGVTRDITESKKAEQDLKDSEDRYRSLVEQAADVITLFDAGGKILDVNNSATELLGYSKPELLELNIADIIEESDMLQNPVQFDLLNKGESTIRQRRMRRKNGTIVETEVHARKLPDGTFLALVRDLTERINVQHQIEREKQLSDSVINSLPGIFYLFDHEGKFLRWNKNLEIISGYSAQEISQMHPLDFFDTDEKALVGDRINKVFTTGDADVEANFLLKDKRKIPYYFNGWNLIFEGKQCLIGVGIDITDRKKAEVELDASYRAVRKLTGYLQDIREQERAHIAREIHDELGQQLTVLKMDVSWLSKKLPDTTEPLVKERIKDLLEMLDGTVKTVRRISSELRPSLLDDLGLVAAMEWQLSEFEKRSGIRTSFVPPKGEFQLHDNVKTAVFRIFQESLTNVVRHAHAEKVDISLLNNNGSFILRITDDGKGFDKDKIADKRTLGILGMKERTAMIGGTYEIQSMPGKGTTVVVAIPAAGNN